MTKKATTLAKYAAIRARFKRLDAIRYKGVKKYTTAYIYAKVADEYFMSSSSVEKILFNKHE